MNEEIKLSWKGKIHLSSIELFVGRVISKEIKNKEISVILEGKDLKKNRFELLLGSLKLVCVINHPNYSL